MAEIGIMLRAGVSLRDALELSKVSATNNSHLQLATTLSQLEIKLNELVDNLERNSTIPPALCTYLNSVGEDRLPQALVRSGLLLQKLFGAKKLPVIFALTYPTIVGGIAFVIFLILMIYVVPVFVSTYADFGVRLPSLTEKVVYLSRFVTHHLVSLILGILVLWAVTQYLWARFGFFQRVVHGCLRGLPLFGSYIASLEILVFLESLRLSTTQNGINKNGVLLASQITPSRHTRKRLQHIYTELSEKKNSFDQVNWEQLYGRKIAKILQLIHGHKTADKVLFSFIQRYRDEVSTKRKKCRTIIEPMAITIIGCVLAIILFSMYLPIFQITSLI